MAERRYGKVGSGAIRAPSMEPRKGVVAVAAKQPMEVPAARPERGRDPQIDELQLPGYPPAHSPQGSCIFCSHTDANDILVQGPPASDTDSRAEYMVCGTCVERLVDTLRSELPRRRLRLAMERLAAGPVDIATVEAVERLAGQRTDNSNTDGGK